MSFIRGTGFIYGLTQRGGMVHLNQNQKKNRDTKKIYIKNSLTAKIRLLQLKKIYCETQVRNLI